MTLRSITYVPRPSPHSASGRSWRYLSVHLEHTRVQRAPPSHAAIHLTLHRRRLLYQRGGGRLAVCYPVSLFPSPQPHASISRVIIQRRCAVLSEQRILRSRPTVSPSRVWTSLGLPALHSSASGHALALPGRATRPSHPVGPKLAEIPSPSP